jgi:thioredoxin-related protein
MEQPRIQRYLEIGTNIAVLLVATVVVYVCTWTYFHANRKTQLLAGLQTGTVLTNLSNINYNQSSKTLIIAMNTNCGYCQASVPFYNQLTELQKTKAKGSRIIAVLPNNEEEVKQFTQQNHLNIETASSVNLRPLKITGTPTLVLVDGNGIIHDFWLGKLSQDQEQEVIKAISTSTM